MAGGGPEHDGVVAAGKIEGHGIVMGRFEEVAVHEDMDVIGPTLLVVGVLHHHLLGNGLAVFGREDLDRGLGQGGRDRKKKQCPGQKSCRKLPESGGHSGFPVVNHRLLLECLLPKIPVIVP